MNLGSRKICCLDKELNRAKTMVAPTPGFTHKTTWSGQQLPVKEALCLIDPFEHLPVMMELKHDLYSTPAEMLEPAVHGWVGVAVGSHAPSSQGDIQIRHNHPLNSVVEGTRSICWSRWPICSQVDLSPLNMVSPPKALSLYVLVSIF